MQRSTWFQWFGVACLLVLGALASQGCGGATTPITDGGTDDGPPVQSDH